MTTSVDAVDTTPRIRPAGTSDLLDVYRIERQSFPQPWPFEAFQRHIEAPAFFVAEVDTELVGYVVGDIAPGFPGRVGHIKDLAVHPAYRRRGVARKLLERALTQLEDHGVVRTSLEVRESNDAAIALYRSLGFEPWRTRPRYYPDGEAAIIMVHR